MRAFLARFVNHRSGTTAIEYSLIAALVVMALVGALTSLGGNLLATFNLVSSAFP